MKVAGWIRFAALALFVLGTSLWAAAMLRRLHADGPVRVAATARGDPVAAVKAAVGAEVRIDRLAPVRRDGSDARAMVVLSGPEQAVRRAIRRMETARPAIRFSEWRLRPEPGLADRLRFDGVARVTAE